MSYTKSVNFTAKDALALNDPGKYVKGSDFDTEFDAIQVADALNVKTSGALGTPSSGTLTNCTGLPAAGVTGTALVAAAIGTTVQAYDADLTTWAGITPGANVGTALAVAVGTDGAFVVKGGALGTPSSGNLANCTGAGVTVQVVEATPYTTAGSTAATMLIDSSIPQNTEGLELTTVTITPTSATNRLRISASIPLVDADNIRTIVGALFQDATANALATGVGSILLAGGNVPTSINFDHEMAAGTTSATTFKLRLGVSGGTAYINRQASAATLGGVTAVRLRVEEIKV